MDEVVIRLNVEADEAIAATDAETAALKRLEAQAGRTGEAGSKSAKQEAKDRKTAQKAVEDYGRASDAVYKKQASSDRDRSRSTQMLISDLQKVRDATLKQAGYTTQSLAKEEEKRTATAQRYLDKRADNEKRALAKMESERTRSDARLAAQEKSSAARGNSQAQRVADFRSKLYREMYDDILTRAQKADDALERMESATEKRRVDLLNNERSVRTAFIRDMEKRAEEWVDHDGNLLSEHNRTTVSGLTMVRNAYREMYGEFEQRASLFTRIEDDELAKRTTRWQRFSNDLARMGGGRGGRGGGQSFFHGGGDDGPVRRTQFSRNRFVDFGGRGLQPRTIGIGSLVGLAAAGAGPLGAAAGGLLGAVPGAAAGIGASIAAFKMSGLGAVAADAAKIQTIQNNIAAGVVKEAKGRAQIAAVLKGMTPEQEKALKLWDSFHKITTGIGDQVSDKMLPAFGALGKALGANAPAITTSIVTAGKAWAGLLTQMSGFISGGAGKTLFSGLLGSGNTFITGLTHSLGNLGEVFISIGGASQKFMHQIMTMSSTVTGSLAAWSSSSQGQKDLKAFFAVAAQEIPRVLGLFKDLGGVLFTIFRAALPFANQFIDAIRHALQNLNTFLQSARGQADMKQLFQTLKSAIEGVASAVSFLWPVISKVFGLISGAVNTLTSLFGDKLGGALAIAGGYFTSKLLSAALPVFKEIGAGLVKLALTNPWVAAVAGTTILLLWLHQAETQMDVLKSKAKATGDEIKGVFSAAANTAMNNTNLTSLNLQKSITGGSIGSEEVKLKGLRAEQAKSGRTPKNNAEIQQTLATIARLRVTYQGLNKQIADTKSQNAQNVKTIADDTTKATNDIQSGWNAAIKATQRFTGATPRSGGRQNPLTPPDLSKAKASFTAMYKQLGFGADSAGERAKLAMDKIANMVQATGRVPTKKQITFIINNLAKKPLDNILAQLARIHDKNFKIIAHPEQALESITKIANEHVGDKHFNIIGTIINPRKGNPLDPQPITTTQPAGGGVIPGVGGHDTIPAMLRPGEVVLNRAQQYDFGGPEVFKNYFGSKSPGLGYAGGGIIGYDGPKGKEVKVIVNPKKSSDVVAAPTATPKNPIAAAPVDAEPDITQLLSQLANTANSINFLTKLKAGAKADVTRYKDVVLHSDYNKRTDLNQALNALSGKKNVTAQRVSIKNQQHNLAKKILDDQEQLRHAQERYSTDGRNLRSIKKQIWKKIPGFESFESIEEGSTAAQLALAVQAANLPALDPNANPNAPNGIATLTGAWKNFNTLYSGQEALAEGGFNQRIAWLGQLVGSLGSRPKMKLLAQKELTADQADLLATIGRSLSDAVPPGAGPGDVITNTTAPGGGSSNAWSDNPMTKAFQGFLASDAAQAAMALISPQGTGDPIAWLAAMTDEKNTLWGRLGDLNAVKDNAAYAQWRPDILSEITDDAGSYSSVVQAISAGFASAQGSSSSGGDDSHVQEVIDAANTLMSQINVASATDRESLSALTGFLASQVPSFETGASYVGRSGLAMVHQGEHITPRGDVGGGAYNHTVTLVGSDKLTQALAEHLTPIISYQQGQSARRRARERRR